MKTAAIIVLYEPQENEIFSVIEKASWFDYLIVYDNSVTNHKNNFQKIENCCYKHTGINNGLAVAYNFALNYCFDNQIDYLCVLDQDSSIDDKSVHTLFSFVNKFDENVAIICPFVKYRDNDIVPSNAVESVKWTINSGSILNVKLLLSNGIRYDEKYFLDRLDRDFCKQITQIGLKIMRVNKAVMRQQLGDIVNGKTVHSPLRNYYIFRNRLYYNHKFYCFFQRTIINFFQSFRHILMIMGEKDSLKKMIACKNAFWDYKRGFFGKK